MLAVYNSLKYPQFDSLELEPEVEFTFNARHALKPIKKGDTAPDFIFEKDNTRWQQFYNGVETHGPVLLNKLLNKTLVLAFYSSSWQDHGFNLLEQLNTIHGEIKENDANLLVISAEKERKLEKIAWDNSLSMNFYIDNTNDIAERFGIYSELDPVWNRFSGIDTNVPLLATYVIAAYGRVLYDHIEWDFSGGFPSNEIIASVRQQELNK
ncbi:MAG: redoxin domain-containing protein [Mucilaginibacter sp.]